MSTRPLHALPARLLRRKFFDPEQVVQSLGWRPTLAALDDEHNRRTAQAETNRVRARPGR